MEFQLMTLARQSKRDGILGGYSDKFPHTPTPNSGGKGEYSRLLKT